MLDAFGVERTDISKGNIKKPTKEELRRKDNYTFGGMAAGVAAGLPFTPVIGGKIRGAVKGTKTAVKGSYELQRIVGGSKASSTVRAARNAPAGAIGGYKTGPRRPNDGGSYTKELNRSYAPIYGLYGGMAGGITAGNVRNQKLRAKKEKAPVSKGLPSALRGGNRISGPGADIIGRTMQGANWSGKQAARQLSSKRPASGSTAFRQGQAGGFIKQGKDQKSVRFQRQQWMGTDPTTGKMVDTRGLRNANKGGFKGQFNATSSANQINPSLKARLSARKGA